MSEPDDEIVEVAKNLSEEDLKTLEELRKFHEKRRNTPESERRYVTRPEKYDYPIGIDPKGNPYPVHRREPQRPSRDSADDGG